MGTKILNDIHNDMKQLITAITSFEVISVVYLSIDIFYIRINMYVPFFV